MNFALLLPELPRVQESRPYYDAMLSLEDSRRHRLAAFLRSLKARFS